ncbi:MAG: PhnD/SsuA/transferrin family substrate-binding protein [Rhodospirillaceae bacterium]
MAARRRARLLGASASRLKDAGMAGVPGRLSWQLSEDEQWRAPALLFGQTCGYPLMKGLTGPVRLVATPTYAAPFVEGASYRSLVVVGAGSGVSSLAQLKGKVAAINKPTSHSGYNAFRRLVADYARQSMPEAFASPERAGQVHNFAKVVTAASHLESLCAVAAGKADVAAIDAISFHLISRQMPELTGTVRIVTTTLPAPGLPFITAASRSDQELRWLRSALADTIGDAKLRPHIERLGLSGLQVLGREAYGRVLAFEREAEDMGYPRLA